MGRNFVWSDNWGGEERSRWRQTQEGGGGRGEEKSRKREVEEERVC